jgi:hypothetical protein
MRSLTGLRRSKRAENGRWRIEDGEWRIEDGELGIRKFL